MDSASRRGLSKEWREMNEQAPPLRPLTAFRFLAALAVFLHHVGDFCGRDPVLVKVYRRVLFEGFSGVTFFFVLSGFILTYNYHAIFASLSKRAVWKFYVARFARIYPVHVLAFAVTLPLCYTHFFAATGTAILRAITNLTLIQSFIPDRDYYFSYNAPSWSLSNEFFFYALLPVLLWGLACLRLGRPARSAWLTIGFLAMAFALAWNWRHSPNSHWLCYIDPLYRVGDFSAGVTLGLTYLGFRGHGLGKLNRGAATLVELAGLAGLGVAVYYARAIPFEIRLGSYYTPAMAALVIIFAFQRGWVSALLSTHLFWVLGEISFSFYMFHMVLLEYARAYTLRLHLDRLGPRTSIVLLFSVALVVSILCHYAFERPMRERLKGWLVRDSRESGREEVSSTVRQAA
jgi:peptidoglycan/LPS O-acetylase OafA/YrhL